MTTIVKAASAAEFLSVVPSMLGFEPRQSLVMIPFAGSRTVGAMRFDLPVHDIDAVAATVVGLVCRVQDADAVAAVVYTDDAFSDAGGIAHADLHDAIARRVDACGLRLTDALCVASDAWGSYIDQSCPAGGHPLDELERRPGGPELPPVDGDQSTGADLPPVDSAERERVACSVVALDDALRVLCGPDAAPRAVEDGDSSERRIDPQALAAACALDDLPTLFEAALGWDAASLAPFDAATLIWCLGRPALRDIALTQWCRGLAAGDEALDAQLRWESGEEYPAHLAMQLWGEGERPDVARLDAALDLVRRLAAAAPESARPGPLGTAAWISWAFGRSTHAERYAAQARAIDPEHGLSEIVLSFVAAAHLPDWAFSRSARRS